MWNYLCNIFTPILLIFQFMAAPQMELTQREIQVLQFLVEGMNSREIAKEMFISVNTVQYHRKQLLRKTESHNVAELIGKAYRLNLIPRNN